MSKIILFFIGCALLWFVPAQNANATPVGVCTLAELDAVILAADTGATVFFNCDATLIFPNRIIITSAITIRAEGHAVIFDGNHATRLFIIADTGSLTLDGITLQNGDADRGGVIENRGIVSISASTFIGNSGQQSGGAIHNVGMMSISTSTFTDNRGYYGGAIYNEGTMNISTSTFTGNSADYGGAVQNVGTMSIGNSTFTDNRAVWGGGAVSNTHTLTIRASTFSTNSAQGDGGAIRNLGAMSIIEATFRANSATTGGAVHNYDILTLTDTDLIEDSDTLVNADEGIVMRRTSDE